MKFLKKIMDLFTKKPTDPTDFSSVGAVNVFNNQIAPTFNRVEAKALEAGLGDLDLDGENAAAAARREAQVGQDDQAFKQQAVQDDAFLGVGATDIFGQDSDGLTLPTTTPVEEAFNDGQYGKGGAVLQKGERVNPRSLSRFIGAEVSETPLNGFVPEDGAAYGIKTGSPAEWARFFTVLAKLESSFKNSTKGDVGRFNGGSNGLFQLSRADARNHKLKDSDFTMEELQDPTMNTKAAIAIAARLMLQDGVIAKGKRGAARYWGPLRRGKNPSNQKF